jgi:6-pyruvoyltetrahydropterin/6-carboxytetrahydropterin synthase
MDGAAEQPPHAPAPTTVVATPEPAAFSVEIEREFAAAHAIVLGGVRECVHGHNWRVVASIGGERLDGEELLCDFHLVEGLLGAIVAPFANGDLNRTAPFDRVNPTAEAIARHVGRELARGLAGAAPALRVEWVRVTEAPRCTATAWFEPRPRAAGERG